ncbi:hypothetical protein OROMI_023618 [Orobanche minor]
MDGVVNQQVSPEAIYVQSAYAGRLMMDVALILLVCLSLSYENVVQAFIGGKDIITLEEVRGHPSTPGSCAIRRLVMTVKLLGW